MEVRLAECAGFCFGVKRAVDTVYEQLKTGKTIYTYGPIVHNEEVVKELEEKGVRVIENKEELLSMEVDKNAAVIIRAHGVSKETYELMSAQTSYHFAGNCEARDIFAEQFDVVVADGFDGNLILKHTEGFAKALFSMMKHEMMETTLRAKIGALLVKPALYKIKRKMDYNSVGGAPLLGVNGAVVKAHGSSGEEALENAIGQARDMLAGNVVGKIRDGLAGLEA